MFTWFYWSFMTVYRLFSAVPFICTSTIIIILNQYQSYRQLRARRALILFKDVPLRTRRALSLYKVCGDSALLVLNGILLNSVNALLALSQQYISMTIIMIFLYCNYFVIFISNKAAKAHSKQLHYHKTSTLWSMCVCECVFAEKQGPFSDILHSDCGRTTKRGRPRIGEIVLMVANSTCIHMRMC